MLEDKETELRWKELSRRLALFRRRMKNPPRTLFHYYGLTFGMRRKLVPWYRVWRSVLPGRSIYSFGFLYWAFAVSNPFALRKGFTL